MNILTEFKAFTPAHAIIVLICSALMLGIPLLARRLSPACERPLRLTIALTTLAWQALINAWWLTLAPEGSGDPLPLHVCDVAAIVAGLSLLPAFDDARWMKTLLYFWGIALSTQAFITPVLTKGIASPAFWSFWIGHTQIVGVALYHTLTLRYRPRLQDLLFIFALSLAYAALVTPINIAAETNYGYIGPSKPDKPTLIDALGQWPRRILWSILIAFAAMTVAYLPWPIAARLAKPPTQTV